MKNLHLKSEVNLKSLSVEKISNVGQACSFVRIEALAHVFSCEFGKISKNTFSYRTPQVIASVQYYFLRKNSHLQFCKELYQLIQLIEGMLWGCIGVCVQGQPQRKEQYEKIRCQIYKPFRKLLQIVILFATQCRSLVQSTKYESGFPLMFHPRY